MLTKIVSGDMKRVAYKQLQQSTRIVGQ